MIETPLGRAPPSSTSPCPAGILHSCMPKKRGRKEGKKKKQEGLQVLEINRLDRVAVWLIADLHHLPVKVHKGGGEIKGRKKLKEEGSPRRVLCSTPSLSPRTFLRGKKKRKKRKGERKGRGVAIPQLSSNR